MAWASRLDGVARDVKAAQDLSRHIEGVDRRPVPTGPLARGLMIGVNLTTSFASSLIPSASDLPDVDPIVAESGEGLGPFGARGIGEPPIAPPAAAVANAVEDATGVRITELPLTPERVARALGLLETIT